MKKLIMILLLFIPFITLAEEYKFEDATIVLDNKWVVFTRDNLENNPDLEKHKISYDRIKNMFSYNNVYLDASIFDSITPTANLEFIVGIKDSTLKYNLHNYNKKQLKNIEKEMVTEYSDYKILDHRIHENDNYKYIYIYYKDKSIYIIDYYTFVNGKSYTFKFQKADEYTKEDINMFDSIVNDITFVKNEEFEQKPPTNSLFKNVILYAFIGAVIGGLSALLTKKKKKL